MGISSISGSLLLYRAEQTQQGLSTALMKQAANSQNQLANLLAQNAQQVPSQTSRSDSSVSFSTYV